MNNSFTPRDYEIQNHSSKKIRYVFNLIFTIIVILSIVNMLILPANSMANTLICAHEEHIHTDLCYEICTQPGKKVLICEIGKIEENSEIEADVSHTHDSFCFDENENLICSLEESEHIHDDACYNESDELICNEVFHQHNEDCFHVLQENESARIMICAAEVHHHENICYRVHGAVEPAAVVKYQEDEISDIVDSEYESYENIELPAAHVEISENLVGAALDTSGAIDLRENGKNYIDSITISYNDGINGWIEIDDSNNSDLSASADYRLKISYNNIHASDLKNAGGKMLFKGVPEWLKADGIGKLVAGSEPVADIEVRDSIVLISFYESYLHDEVDTDIVSGSFFVRGEIAWDKLFDSKPTHLELHPLNIDLNFEDDLPSKYGEMTINKSAPVMIIEGDRVYFKYSVTIASQEDEAIIPEIIVRDHFTRNSHFIKDYMGITGNSKTIVDSPSGKNPWETGNVGAHGTIRKNDTGMEWSIAELKPGESRTLNYYVEVDSKYIGTYGQGDIDNKAAAFSKNYPKCDDVGTFTPHADVNLSKKQVSCDVDKYGSGTISYEVIVSAPKNNSYTLENVTLHDSFDEKLREFIKGNKDNKLSIEISGNKSVDVPYNNGTFDFTIPSLEPGETKNIKYTVKTENIFAANNGDINLHNVARINSENRADAPSKTFKASESRYTLKQNNWLRKIKGGNVNTDHVDIPAGEKVYQYNGDNIEEAANPGGFELSSDSLKYQIILNEDGRWDMSSTIMKDKFNTNHMLYKGYVQVSAFKLSEGTVGDHSGDNALLSILNNSQSEKTVWLDVDGRESYSFTPEQIGAGEDKYVYLLTYYAAPTGLEKVNTMIVTNNFAISGTIGVNGEIFTIPEMLVAVNDIVQGGLHYEAEKLGWYYEKDPGEKGTVPIWTNGTSYNQTGAIYWIIRLEGTIPEGFGLRDTLSAGGMKFCYDSIPGVYRGSKELNLTEFSSFGDMINNHVGIDKELVQLNGNRYNYYWNKNDYIGDKNNPDYLWTLKNGQATDPLIVTFQKEVALGDDEALYVVVRTTPNSRPNPTVQNNAIYKNKISINAEASNDTTWIDGNEAVYCYKVVTAIYKEGKGAFAYNKDTNSWENISTEKEDHHNAWDKSKITESGIYSEWLVNVNWDGSLSGSEIVSDQLPEGMEFVYADICWIGDYVQGDPPKFQDIPELDDNDDWQKMEYDSGSWHEKVVSYYNPATREIRWNIYDLTENTAPSGTNNHNQINLRVITKVTDKDVFLSGSKTFENHATVMSDNSNTDYGIITINKLYSIKKKKDDSVTNKKANELAFKIEVNPTGEDLCSGDVLPVLVDELSNNLRFIESSIAVHDSLGNIVTGYTFSIEENDDSQILYVSGLPDNKQLVLTYMVRALSKPDVPISINNRAYWSGYAPPADAQYVNREYKYDLGGSVDVSHIPFMVTLIKADSVNLNKKLAGAKFDLYKVTNTGDVKIGEGTTGADGTLKFDNNSNMLNGNRLTYDTIYYVVETKAPNGYRLDGANTRYYFAAASTPEAELANEIEGNKVDIVYGSSEYSRTIKNQKGEISVNKIFNNDNGEEISPRSGKYTFGLYDKVPDHTTKPLQTLTIEYTDDGAIYYLDGVKKDSPNFTCAEVDELYYIYELDDNGNPVSAQKIANINHYTYEVAYFIGGRAENTVTINHVVEVVNTERAFELPYTGGIGLKKYYIYNGILILMAAFIVFLKSLKKKA